MVSFLSLFLICAEEEMASVVHKPPAALAKVAHLKSIDEYRSMYEQSIKDPAVSIREYYSTVFKRIYGDFTCFLALKMINNS